eukprot:NODE_7403_length_769_cov_105.583591_g7161_i0.p1 GENE.NODE_7403_length_769_cov_105.583591_g7161_i0~~NODE_7403_length_769_cov_105.583591_g7161_i0.p1  ORF type:complete len:182 (+),score=35.64 NODE_7403_length_769_cov_105.583591_g7161_i0:57-548(+)
MVYGTPAHTPHGHPGYGPPAHGYVPPPPQHGHAGGQHQHQHRGNDHHDGVYDHGLCSWYEDINLCLLGWCAGCIPYGRTSAFVDGNPDGANTAAAMCCLLHFCTGCGCIMEFMTRQKVRRHYGIEGSTAKDFLIAWCCLCCSIIQNARQVGQEGCDGPDQQMM